LRRAVSGWSAVAGGAALGRAVTLWGSAVSSGAGRAVTAGRWSAVTLGRAVTLRRCSVGRWPALRRRTAVITRRTLSG
jgi:hypothetical protein